MSENADLKRDAAQAILKRICKETELGNNPQVLQLAEAYAWLTGHRQSAPR